MTEILTKPDTHEVALDSMTAACALAHFTHKEFLEGYLKLRGIEVADLDAVSKPVARSAEWVESNPQYRLDL